MGSLVWFTGQPAPYRLPAWDYLARSVDLTVVLTGVQQANRPEWTPPADAPFDVIRLRPTLASSDSDSARTGFVNPGRLAALLRRRRPDAVVVQAWGDMASLQASATARALGIPRIGFYGSTPASRSARGAVALMRDRHLRALDAIVTYGRTTTALLCGAGIPEHRIVTGFNTVDVRSIHAATAAVRSREAPPSSLHRFLFVGQLVHRKAPELAVEAMSLPGLASATLTVLGDGPMRSDLEQQAARQGTSERISFLGICPPDEVTLQYADSHTLVMPSRSEVWGLVANEALAAGLHVVLSETAGCAEDLADHPGVYIAKPDVASLTEQMARSAREWQGWIVNPQMLTLGPERLAQDVLRALDLAGSPRDAYSARAGATT